MGGWKMDPRTVKAPVSAGIIRQLGRSIPRPNSPESLLAQMRRSGAGLGAPRKRPENVKQRQAKRLESPSVRSYGVSWRLERQSVSPKPRLARAWFQEKLSLLFPLLAGKADSRKPARRFRENLSLLTHCYHRKPTLKNPTSVSGKTAPFLFHFTPFQTDTAFSKQSLPE
jgi:hypothetical protein